MEVGDPRRARRRAQRGDFFLTDRGVSVPKTNFTLRPPVRAIEDPDLSPLQYKARCTVRLRVGAIDTGDLRFESLPFFVLPLRIPTALAMFVNTNFQANAADTEGPCS